MFMLLSPAKSLDFETPVPAGLPCTQPGWLQESAALIECLRQLSPAQVAALMDLSDKLAVLNVTRYAEWSLPFTPENAKQAVLAFNGDVYEGLDAPRLQADDLEWAQAHLGILSGLYGLLRPLDLIQPYRLEMGTKLANSRGKDLYAWWGDRLRDAVQAATEASGTPVLVNLASEEYFKAVRPQTLRVPVIQPVFEDWKGGRYKIISFYAKRARGLMARYAIEQRIDDPEGLKDFNREGYAFDPAASEGDSWVFRRRQAD
ncbi:peroxide stress protein YaaA [Azovibrio restrictus]|uniref:peroxide stress protein YaaA n=1 Tax=Azovibrio restrictus TaxID=146938 RepID=UPI0026F2DD83|nr:peroxide stress protein YaaA [Azovibrio restrictus]